MIRAGASLDDGGTTEVDIAIVGAGAVGIALAVRLRGQRRRIALIEAGGRQFRHAHNLKYFKASVIADERHPPTELYRRRMLGGTTSVWGGRCIPLDPEDFAPSAQRIGWPIAFEEVNAHVPAALAFLDAGEPDFSATSALATLRLPPDAEPHDLIVDRIERFSKPTDVWRKCQAVLVQDHNVTVIFGAACTGVTTNETGTRATGVQLRTEANRSHLVLAGAVILACGGLETPRLLLASRATLACGLGNERDLVGRFYMTHLVGNVGALGFARPDIARAFGYGVTPDGVYGRRLMVLPPQARLRDGIGNIVFRPAIPAIDDPSHGDPVLSAMFLAKGLIIPEYARRLSATLGPDVRGYGLLREHGVTVVRGLPKLGVFGVDWMRRRILATRKLPSVFLYRPDGTYPLEFNAEQWPNADSRVLTGNEVDPFGMPRLIVQWRTQDRDGESICRAFTLLAAAFAASRLGSVRVDADLPATVSRAVVPQGGHHIGTARMGDSPASSVVDPNGEVWGTKGLFVVGTATFPTSGFANPTLTAVALAFRLAEYLMQQPAAARAA